MSAALRGPGADAWTRARPRCLLRWGNRPAASSRTRAARWGRLGGTKAGVFHDHRHCNFAPSGRSGIERVVALVFFQQLGVVIHVLAQAHGLRGTGLAGRGIGRAWKHAAPCRPCSPQSGVAHDLHVLGLVAQVLAGGWGTGSAARHRIFTALMRWGGGACRRWPGWP